MANADVVQAVETAQLQAALQRAVLERGAGVLELVTSGGRHRDVAGVAKLAVASCEFGFALRAGRLERLVRRAVCAKPLLERTCSLVWSPTIAASIRLRALLISSGSITTLIERCMFAWSSSGSRKVAGTSRRGHSATQ